MKKKLIRLNINHQATIKNESSNYDIVKKNWGFYVTPSFQKR